MISCHQIVIRDYSDWAWSAYNYWCSVEYDSECDEASSWAMAGHHNRSVETFDQIVRASVEGRNFPSPLKFNNTCNKASKFYRSYVDRLRSSGISEESFAVLASEQLEADPAQFWAQLAIAAGLPQQHPSIDSFKKYRYNVQVRCSVVHACLAVFFSSPPRIIDWSFAPNNILNIFPQFVVWHILSVGIIHDLLFLFLLVRVLMLLHGEAIIQNCQRLKLLSIDRAYTKSAAINL